MERFSRRFGFRLCKSLGVVGLFFAIPLFGQITYLPPSNGGEGVIGGGGLTTDGSITYVCALGTICQDTSFTRSNPGRYTLYDATPTTGVTTLTVRAGAGQSTTYIQSYQSSAGSVLSGVRGDGVFMVDSGIFQSGDNWLYTGTTHDLRSTFQIRWTSAGATGTKDLGLARAGAGILKVTDGSTGLGGIIIASQTPASAAATGTQGQIAWDADYIYVCTATDTWKRVAIATWP